MSIYVHRNDATVTGMWSKKCCKFQVDLSEKKGFWLHLTKSPWYPFGGGRGNPLSRCHNRGPRNLCKHKFCSQVLWKCTRTRIKRNFSKSRLNKNNTQCLFNCKINTTTTTHSLQISKRTIKFVALIIINTRNLNFQANVNKHVKNNCLLEENHAAEEDFKDECLYKI